MRMYRNTETNFNYCKTNKIVTSSNAVDDQMLIGSTKTYSKLIERLSSIRRRKDNHVSHVVTAPDQTNKAASWASATSFNFI